MIKILVVEDDKKLNQIVCSYLNNLGYTAKGCLNANSAFHLMYNDPFDLIISDIMMPEMDGYEFAKAVRGVSQTLPILFMTARDDFSSMEQGYEAGIDDYMVKPVNFNELHLRIKALLRRANIFRDKRIHVGGLIVDASSMTITLNGEVISTSVREFNILYKLLSYPNHPFSRSQLMDEFWGIDSKTTLRAVDVYISKLRDKLTACSEFEIITVYGLGYKVAIH